MHIDPATLATIGHFLAGAGALSAVAHGLSTFPTPVNKYGQWLLGFLKYLVGQRITGEIAFQGLQAEVTAVTTKQKEALKNGSSMRIVKTPDGISKPVTAEEPLEE